MKGTFTFNFRPDYEQDVTKSRDVVPTSDYAFDIDMSEGMQITTHDIQFHFNAFLRSLGYVVDYDNNL